MRNPRTALSAGAVVLALAGLAITALTMRPAETVGAKTVSQSVAQTEPKTKVIRRTEHVVRRVRGSNAAARSVVSRTGKNADGRNLGVQAGDPAGDRADDHGDDDVGDDDHGDDDADEVGDDHGDDVGDDEVEDDHDSGTDDDNDDSDDGESGDD